MATIQLKPNWPGNFRRTVRGPAGEELRVLTWAPGESQQLDGEDLAAVADDLGKSLQEVRFDEAKGKLVPVPATSAEADPEPPSKDVELEEPRPDAETDQEPVPGGRRRRR